MKLQDKDKAEVDVTFHLLKCKATKIDRDIFRVILRYERTQSEWKKVRGIRGNGRA